MRHKKSSEDDVKITHNNVMLKMDSSLIDYFRARGIEERAMGIEELERKKEETEDAEFDVDRAMDDMRARVLTGMIENFLSKIIPKRFRKKQEIGPNIHEMEKKNNK